MRVLKRVEGKCDEERKLWVYTLSVKMPMFKVSTIYVKVSNVALDVICNTISSVLRISYNYTEPDPDGLGGIQSQMTG
jgi:hypothetical protein